MEKRLARHACNDGGLENEGTMAYDCQLEDSERLDPIMNSVRYVIVAGHSRGHRLGQECFWL